MYCLPFIPEFMALFLIIEISTLQSEILFPIDFNHTQVQLSVI